MTARAERQPALREPKSFTSILAEIPDAISFAKLETETSDMAKTPEGKFVLTYLLAARTVLRPTLAESHVHNDLLKQTGGYDYNPTRNIDEVGTSIAATLAKEAKDIPNMWMHTEECADWMPTRSENGFWEDAETFAVVDPMDMTSSIPRGKRVQTTGVAIYSRDGSLRTVGIMSLVDEQFVFIENVDGVTSVHSNKTDKREDRSINDRPIRYAAKVRRMFDMKDTPLTSKKNVWSMDCDSGYATLGLHNEKIDTAVDHIKGNPWYEVVIWLRAAQALDMTVSDKDGNPIDLSAVMRRVIKRHEGDTYRVPFVMSRTPEIHKRVLSQLQPNTTT